MIEGDTMSIGKNIKSLRQERGYSQKELAEVLNISPSCLSKYESDKAQIPPETMISIADTLNVSLDYIFGRSNVPWDANCLNESYVNKTKLSTLVETALSLDSSNRKLHWKILKAIKCQSDVEKINSPE